jgi:hypothetical protein
MYCTSSKNIPRMYLFSYPEIRDGERITEFYGLPPKPNTALCRQSIVTDISSHIE